MQCLIDNSNHCDSFSISIRITLAFKSWHVKIFVIIFKLVSSAHQGSKTQLKQYSCEISLKSKITVFYFNIYKKMLLNWQSWIFSIITPVSHDPSENILICCSVMNRCTAKDPSVKLLRYEDDTTIISLIHSWDESAYRQEVKGVIHKKIQILSLITMSFQTCKIFVHLQNTN